MSVSTAYPAETSSGSTRSMNRIDSRNASSAAAVPGSTWSQVAVPSSVSVRWCSMCPVGLRMSASAAAPGGSWSSRWVVRLCSQDSRSAPVIRSTPRCERSTRPAAAASARCSAYGSP